MEGDWQLMGTAPDDGTWVLGRDEEGREAKMQARQIHPSIDLRRWFEGDPEQEGEWERNKCFYPVEWKHLAEGV